MNLDEEIAARVDRRRQALEKILRVNHRAVPVRWLAHVARRADYCVVLVAGAIGDYAAYAGIELIEPQADPLWVMEQGQKLLFEEALMIWPDLESERYRR